MSAKTEFLKKLASKKSASGCFATRSQADIAEFYKKIGLLQECIEAWLVDTGIKVESFCVALTDLLVGSQAFTMPGIALSYENRSIRFTPLYLYGQQVTGCMEISLYSDGKIAPLYRLFMRSQNSKDWSCRASGGLPEFGSAFCEERFFEIIEPLLP